MKRFSCAIAITMAIIVGLFQGGNGEVMYGVKDGDQRKERKGELLGMKIVDVVVSHPIPQSFFVNQIFTIYGQILQQKLLKYLISTSPSSLSSSSSSPSQSASSPSPKKSYPLNFILTNLQTQQKTIYKQQLLISVRNFRQQLYFTQEGQFRFVVIVGEYYGTTGSGDQGVVLEVLGMRDRDGEVDGDRKVNVRIRPIGLSVSVENNQVCVRWVPQATFTKVRVFQQSGQQKIFISSNEKGLLKLPIPQFQNFTTQTPTHLQITHSQSLSPQSPFSHPLQKSFTITTHSFQTHDQNLLKILSINNSSLLSRGDVFQIVGFCYEDVLEVGLLMRPDGRVVEVGGVVDGGQGGQKGEGKGKDGGKGKGKGIVEGFNVVMWKFQVQEEGVYIFQINHRLGFAVYNAPIYVGNRIPLIPDPVDLQQPQYKPIQQIPQIALQPLQTLLHTQINHLRQSHNIPSLPLLPSLSTLAQSHLQDMQTHKYISHINKNNQNSKMRAAKAGIYGPIGENIITGRNWGLLQVRLDRSPLHLRNTAGGWVAVGVGVGIGADGDYYVVEEFLGDEPVVTQQQLDTIKNQFINAYTTKTQQSLTQNQILSTNLKKWFNFPPPPSSPSSSPSSAPSSSSSSTSISPQNLSTLKQLLSTLSIKSVSMLTINLALGVNYFDQIKKNENLKALGKKNIGVAVKYEKGLVKIIGIFY